MKVQVKMFKIARGPTRKTLPCTGADLLPRLTCHQNCTLHLTRLNGPRGAMMCLKTDVSSELYVESSKFDENSLYEDHDLSHMRGENLRTQSVDPAPRKPTKRASWRFLYPNLGNDDHEKWNSANFKRIGMTVNPPNMGQEDAGSVGRRGIHSERGESLQACFR